MGKQDLMLISWYHFGIIFQITKKLEENMPSVNKKGMTLRVPDDLREKIEKAVTLLGMSSVAQFIMQATREKSEQVIREYTVLDISKEDAGRIMNSLENPPEPTQYLLDSLKGYKKEFTTKEGEGL